MRESEKLVYSVSQGLFNELFKQTNRMDDVTKERLAVIPVLVTDHSHLAKVFKSLSDCRKAVLASGESVKAELVAQYKAAGL